MDLLGVVCVRAGDCLVVVAQPVVEHWWLNLGALGLMPSNFTFLKTSNVHLCLSHNNLPIHTLDISGCEYQNMASHSP